MFTFYTTELDLGLGLLAKRDEEREILWAQNVALTWRSEWIDNKFNSKILRQTGKKMEYWTLIKAEHARTNQVKSNGIKV